MTAVLPSSSSRGVALVMVLAFLVLISVFVLGFFSSVSTELKYSKTAANSANANQLADSAVSLAMSQIVEGTRGSDGGSPLAWASQPGMVRTYDSAGIPKKYFKLYSSDNMVGDGVFDPTVSDVIPTDWASKPGEYVDLNAPVLTEDPNGVIQPDTSRPDKYSAVYPIVDPTAQGLVDGFGITAPPGYSGSNPPDASFDPTQKTSGQSNNPAPMPVKWLYVLQDGTLKPANSTGASKANPIVGRVAFWTDDETCKVNINTASEGVYWDIPRINSTEDIGNASGVAAGTVASTPGLALCQPANKEYQRYPGHPATTCLSPVLAKLGVAPYLPSPLPSPGNSYNGNLITAGTVKQLDAYYRITPRIGLPSTGGGAGGGSNGGTRIIGNGTSGTPVQVTTDTDRLYASVDELMFKQPAAGASGQRLTNTSETPSGGGGSSTPKVLTKDALEKARFFLTANSNGPEVTLFNTPRVSIWPVWLDPTKRTAYDKLSAFCGTVGPTSLGHNNEYYFTRQDPRRPTGDLSTRNLALYDYLKAMMAKPIPGIGGNFRDKFGGGDTGDADQILTSIFDYIRCVNLSDTSPGPGPGGKAWPYTPLTNFNKLPSTTKGAGEVVPIRIGATQGFGRFNTVVEFDLLFFKTAADKMGAAVLLGFGSPMQGNVGYQSRLKYKIYGLPGTLNIPNGLEDEIELSDLHTQHGRGLGGIEGPSQSIMNDDWQHLKGGGNTKKYPFVSTSNISVSGTSFPLDPADIRVEIWTADTNLLVQTLHFSLPKTSINLPLLTAGTHPNPPDPVQEFKIRADAVGNHGFEVLIKKEDTVLGLQIGGKSDLSMDTSTSPDNTAGDMRMIAALQDVPAKYFRPHKDWTLVGGLSSTRRQAFGLVCGLGLPYLHDDDPNVASTQTGRLVANANYMDMNTVRAIRQPGIPSRVNGATRADGRPGDWDTGTGTQKDGAYINKADEGDQQFSNYIAPYGNRIPYISKDDHFQADGSVFSPNRQIASPMMFGSIPTGVKRHLPWQTLLFNPHPEDTHHPGFGTPQNPPPGTGYTTPPDHVIADMFWMPVVEPYAISQPLATNGKINMNYQIQPFTYIRRATGMYAVMKSTKFLVLALNDAKTYKPHTADWPLAPGVPNRRRTIHMENTLKAFDDKFATNEIFRSATQICEMNLVPASMSGGNANASSYTAMKSFWGTTLTNLTGDNLREKPYVDLYPRLTTKSNTYTVHVCVQTLKKNPQTDPSTFVDPDSAGNGPKDAVLSEYRGSSIIERYIDPNDPNLPDFATLFTNSSTNPALNIDQYYKFRVVSTKRFAP